MPKSKKFYTIGEVNLLIDAILHPLIEKSENPKTLEVIDSALHLLNEGKLEESVRKTIAHRILPKLRQRILEGLDKGG